MSESESQLKSLSQPTLHRTEEEAAQCKHLEMSPVIRTTETLRPIMKQQPLLLPHQQPPDGNVRLAPITLWPGCPPMGLTCSNPTIVEWARQLMPMEVRHGTNKVETRLEICRLCGAYERRKEQ